MNPIYLWLEGKKKDKTRFHKISGTAELIDVHNECLDDLIADLPSLLSAMEAEIKGKIPKVEDYLKHDPGSPLRISYVDGAMEAEKRIQAIITDYFNHIRG